MAAFGLYCAAFRNGRGYWLPDSLKVAVQLDDGTVVGQNRTRPPRRSFAGRLLTRTEMDCR